MNRIFVIAIALAATLGLSGCMGVTSPVLGTLYTDVQGPIDTEGSIGSKMGKSCATSLLTMIATGDASIRAAAANGGITKIDTVDHSSRNLLGLFGEFCTIVYGE